MAQSSQLTGHSAAHPKKEQATVYDDTQNDPSVDGKHLHSNVGTMLEPLFTWHGKDVYPVFGAEGDGEGEGDSDGEPDTDEDDDTGTGAADKDADTVTRADFDKLRNQLSAADKARAAAEKKIKEQEDAKKDELTKATEQVEQLTKQHAAAQKEIAEMRLQNAFLTADTGITWHDPADALALAERQGYLAEVVADDGKVDASKLKAKLKELAKAKPHLVKSGETNTDQKKPPSSGAPVGSKGNGGGDKGDKIPSRYDRFIK